VIAAGAARPVLALPAGVEAHEPPEALGLRRDDVRLLVSDGDRQPEHARFSELPRFLAPGDLVVVNTSATLPAAVVAHTPGGIPLRVHISTRLPADLWLVEAREPAGVASSPFTGDLRGSTLSLPEGGAVDVLQRYPGSMRLWLAALRLPVDLATYLSHWGQPIRYPYVTGEWPIDMYQTVYATEAGSAEMPSAGRPFTAEVITALVARGIGIAPLVLHTGVSSLESDERPYPERFTVPAHTARRVNETRGAGRRVIAIGTTTVRALESVVDASGTVHPGSGWTDVVVTPERGASAVDGLLTGFHDPTASHLQMLEAIAGRSALEIAYTAAREHGYRWHEFGDSHLILRVDD
jgi:S-adenosylmethionine:tRNA ribosyltransferase-isomerase